MGEKKLKILVLTGGESSEREVSLDSGRSVTAALLDEGHRVRVIDSLDGEILAENTADFDSRMLTPPEDGNGLIRAIQDARLDGYDVVFNSLHGGKGENGTLAALLEVLDMPYTGSPTAASALAMNKDISKRIMRTLGIATADWIKFDMPAGAKLDEVLPQIIHQIKMETGATPYPLIVKPNDGGSTVGLTLVEKEEDLEQAFKDGFAVSSSVLVETYLEGREITFGVLDGEVLPPVEIQPTHKLYDYTCKYTKGKSKYICPAELDDAVHQKLAIDASRFYQAIECRGYARIDFIVAPTTQYICLELNTLPGMTELSLFPMAAREAGLSFGELLTRLCNIALGSKK